MDTWVLAARQAKEPAAVIGWSQHHTELACLRQSSAAADTDVGQENMDPHVLRQHASHPATPEGASKGQCCSSPSLAVMGPSTPAHAD